MAHFGTFGTVLRTTIMYDPVTGTPTGSAHMEFGSKAEASRALVLNGSLLLDRPIYVVRVAGHQAILLGMRPVLTGNASCNRLGNHQGPCLLSTLVIYGSEPLLWLSS